MSFSLKREIEFYINDVDSTDGVQKLAILPEFQLELSAELIQVYRKIIGEDPEMLPRGAVDQISPISLGFITYLKPSLLDGKVGITAPEKILYDSLGGVLGYRGPEYYKVQFGRVNRLLPLYIFLKTTTAIYKINLAYISSLEISYDINYILVGKWSAQAISLEIFDVDDITFTNVKDYSNISTYLRNKFTITTVTDYDNNAKEYKFPITESNIKIVNSLMPVYDKNIKVVTGKPKDLIVTGRALSGELTAYLSSRIDHSKEFLQNLLNNLDKVNRKFKVSYLTSDGINSVELILPHAQLNVPNLDFQDVLNVKLQFSSSESEYGLNDDTSLKYYVNTDNSVDYATYVKYAINPEYWYRFNETQNTTLYNLGTKGATFNLPRTNSAPVINLSGPYLNSKSWKFNSTTCQISTLKDPVDEVFFSFWHKSDVVNANEYLFAFQLDNFNQNYRFHIKRGASLSGGGYRGIYLDVGNSGGSFDVTNIGSWHHIVCYYRLSTGKLVTYLNNVKVIDTTVGGTSIAGDNLGVGPTGGNGTSLSYFSELIISQNVSLENVEKFTNILYNISDLNLPVSDVTFFKTDYSDTLLQYRGFSNYYYNVVKSYNAKAFWRFNDNDSTKVRDHITGAYPLTLSNRPELGMDGPLLNDDKSKSIWFNRLADGTFQYTTSSSPISTSGITKNTYAFWVYIDDDNLPDNNYRQCLLKTGSNTQTIFTLLRRAGDDGKVFKNGKWYYNYSMGYNDGSYDCSYSFATYFPIALKEWTFVALSCNRTNNTIKIYVNGIYIATTTNGNVNSWWPSTIALEVGKRTYVANYRSTFRISEFAYFENELSDTTIQGIYAASGITGFSYTITPSSIGNSLSVRKYIPLISRGRLIFPENNSVQINGSQIQIRKINTIDILNTTTLVFSKIPLIHRSRTVKAQKLSLNISGNNISIKVLKFVRPISGDVRLHKNVIKVQRIFEPDRGGIYSIGIIPIVIDGSKFIYVSSGLLQKSGNIPVIKKIAKTIKCSVGHVYTGQISTTAYTIEINKYSNALYYKFDESTGTTLYDYSGNTRHATLYNTPTLRQAGPHGSNSYSMYFDKGSLEHAIYNSAITMPAQGTISFWVKTNGQGTFDHLFQFNYAYNAGNNTNYFKFVREATYWIMPFASGWNSNWQMTISDATWTHVAVTWNTSTNQISTYKNGTVVTNNGSHTSWPTSLQPLGICRGNRDGTSYYHNAYFSNFVLTNQRLSDASITDLYNKSTSVISFNNIPTIVKYAQNVQEAMIVFI